MYGIIDRLEEGLAVIEMDDGSTRKLTAAELPEGAREGDALLFDGESVTPDPAETERRRAETRRLMGRVWED